MRSSTTNGITLVEVVAALALMGSLLTVVMISSSQHLRQVKAAERKRESVRLLDDFLASWSVSNFDPDRINDAAVRSGLPATGPYGTHDASQSSNEPYQVHIQRVGNSGFEVGSVLRLTVSAAHATKGRTPTAWAEIMVPQ